MRADASITIPHLGPPRLDAGSGAKENDSRYNLSGIRYFERGSILEVEELVKVSSKSRYALMALVELDLCTRGNGRPVRLVDLAHRRKIPEQFLEQLFAGLRRAGLVAGHRGVGGGFTFARRPDVLTVLDVVRTLDGGFELAACTPGACEPEELLGAGALWQAAGAAYEDVLARTTIADLAERELLLGAGPTYQI
jgi:Rrf2 family transcriptional regulator, cysteine metabolism repressor